MASATPERRPLSPLIEEWLADNTRRQLAITGEFGQGKSTAMLRLCANWAKAYLQQGTSNGRVPLLIELRGQNPAEERSDLHSCRRGLRASDCLLTTHLQSRVNHGQAIVIFEGFDELRNAGRAYDRHEHFNALWRFAFPGTKVLFTGRPNFFLDEAEKNRTLRNDRSKGAAGNAFTELWELDRLTVEEVRAATRGFGASLGEAIVGAAASNPSFLQIVSRPSMLPVVATIWPDIEMLQKRGHTLTSAVLIDRYLQAIYQRKEVEIETEQRIGRSVEAGNYLVLPREIREAFTSIVVWEMVKEDLRNTIKRDQFDQIRPRELRINIPILSKGGVRC